MKCGEESWEQRLVWTCAMASSACTLKYTAVSLPPSRCWVPPCRRFTGSNARRGRPPCGPRRCCSQARCSLSSLLGNLRPRHAFAFSSNASTLCAQVFGCPAVLGIRARMFVHALLTFRDDKCVNVSRCIRARGPGVDCLRTSRIGALFPLSTIYPLSLFQGIGHEHSFLFGSGREP